MFSNRKIILVIILLITVSITGYVLFVVIPTQIAERTYEGARKIGEDIREAFRFTPQVTVNNTVVLQQQAPIFELATLSQKFQHQYTWTNTWLRSTKKIAIKGTFEAKAGFDLHKKFAIEITDDKAVVILPKPQLLSLTPMSDITFEDENGIWNRLEPKDRSAAINAFTRDATRYAQHADFVDTAQKAMEEKLKTLLQAHGKVVEIRYQEVPADETLVPM